MQFILKKIENSECLQSPLYQKSNTNNNSYSNSYSNISNSNSNISNSTSNNNNNNMSDKMAELNADHVGLIPTCVEAPTNKALLVEDPIVAIQATIAATKANIEADNASILKAEEDLTMAKQSKTAAESILEGLRAIRKELEEKRKKSFEASDKEMEDLNDSITENDGKIKKASEKKATALEAVKKAEENLAEKKKTLKMKALMLEKHQNALAKMTKGENKSVKPTTTTTAETPNGGYFAAVVPQELKNYYSRREPTAFARKNFSREIFDKFGRFYDTPEAWLRNQLEYTNQKCDYAILRKVLNKCIEKLDGGGGGGGSKPTTKAIAEEAVKAETPDVSSKGDFPVLGSKKPTPQQRQSGWPVPLTSAASHMNPTTAKAKAKAAKPTAKETTTTAAKDVKTPTTTISDAKKFASVVKVLMMENGLELSKALQTAEMMIKEGLA